MEPGCTKSGAKIKKMRWIAQSGYQMAPKTPLPGTSCRFLAIFGYPLGAQKSTKIDIFPKKPSQGARFHRFLLRMSFSSIFRLIFSRFWMKNQWKKTCFFQALLAVFPTWRPSRNTVFYDTKATFSFFEFLIFFRKIDEKNDWKFHLPKKSKNDPRGTPKYTQNPEKMVAKSPKIPKNAKKVDFLRGRFFDDFLDGQKIEKRRHAHHRLISSPGPGLHWGTIGGTIN